MHAYNYLLEEIEPYLEQFEAFLAFWIRFSGVELLSMSPCHSKNKPVVKIVVLLVIGVSGSGKSTVAEALARALDWTFVDADTFHSQANRLKMGNAIPLTDADRAPWLATLQKQIDTWLAQGQPAVLACSALKSSYRVQLRVEDPRVRTIYLKADKALLKGRLQSRKNHFVGPALLDSQLQDLEEPSPSEALYIDAALPVEQIVASLRSTFQGPSQEGLPSHKR